MEQTLILRPDLSQALAATRAYSEQIASRLEVEDMVVQTAFEVSPIKWHLGHTSWLFEHFILKSLLPGYKPFDPLLELAFNSYYTSVGKPESKAARGSHSRPTVKQVLAYRHYVDRHLDDLLAANPEPEGKLARLLELGIQHEKQHQELMWYDIKHIFWSNPGRPAYTPPPRTEALRSAEVSEWLEFDEGIRRIGHSGNSFAYDNEGPAHKQFVGAFRLASRAVTNQEFQAFLEDGGYTSPRWWLSEGWARVQAEGWQHPLYWERDGSGWSEFTLYGQRPLDASTPVSHVSFYEADAFARWAGQRMPTEAEWETVASAYPPVDGQCNRGRLHPQPQYARPGHAAGLFGDAWEHTQSAYLPYPGYRFVNDGLGEYNGKFMSNQMVLRGSSCFTPEHHTRATYRNFFEPGSRWQCSGIRLAQDA